MDSKLAFRNAFKYRRCLIPADGFYEWQVIAGSKVKQPWFMVLRDREPMVFAGLWWPVEEPAKVFVLSYVV
ncbi:MAG: SOS response-associated peptidase family protein [Methylobacter sp.]|nr:SOS response-associated peptidase family protein [Methylobacter sp.]